MYSQLSTSQQSALANQECPHCHATGTMQEVWTRNGNTVRCNSCKKKVYRPRGRGAVRGDGITGGASGHSEMQSSSGARGQESSSESKSGQPDAAEKAGQAIGKPLSQAAQDALKKMEQAVSAAIQQQLQNELAKIQQEKEAAQQELQQQVSEQVESLRPKEIIIKRTDETGQEQVTEIPNAHPLLAQVIRRINAGIMNFLLVGPSGSGKTMLVRQVAEALALPYSVTPWSAGLTEGGVLGRLTPDGNYLPSAYVNAFEIASVHNWDEIDAADPNVPLCANSGIENGEIFLPARVHSPRATRHKQAYLFATANTWGIGADMLFVGRNQMDAAFRSRFAGGMFFCDYSAVLEQQLVPEQQYRQTFWEVRARIYEHKLRRIWGTRELIRGAMMLRASYTMSEVFSALTVGFSQDELAKCGIA